jgi:hypothetical protein
MCDYLGEVRAQHAVSERGLPVQLAAGVLGEVELGEVVLMARQRGRQARVARRVRRPEAGRQHPHRQLQPHGASGLLPHRTITCTLAQLSTLNSQVHRFMRCSLYVHTTHASSPEG